MISRLITDLEFECNGSHRAPTISDLRVFKNILQLKCARVSSTTDSSIETYGRDALINQSQKALILCHIDADVLNYSGHARFCASFEHVSLQSVKVIAKIVPVMAITSTTSSYFDRS